MNSNFVQQHSINDNFSLCPINSADNGGPLVSVSSFLFVSSIFPERSAKSIWPIDGMEG